MGFFGTRKFKFKTDALKGYFSRAYDLAMDMGDKKLSANIARVGLEFYEKDGTVIRYNMLPRKGEGWGDIDPPGEWLDMVHRDFRDNFQLALRADPQKAIKLCEEVREREVVDELRYMLAKGQDVNPTTVKYFPI